MAGRDRYDTLVVGASTSGLFIARALAASGRRVAVVERKADHALPTRSWIVTPELLRFLPDLPGSAVLHRTGVIEVISHNAKARVPLSPPDLIVERREVMGYLRGRAEEAGVTLLEGVDVQEIHRRDDGLEVLVAERPAGAGLSLLTRDLVGADGVASSVASRFGAGRQDAVPIVQARVELPEGYDPDVTRVWFDRASTRFFFWLIPDSSSTGVLGWVAEAPAQGRAPLESFIAAQGFQPVGFQGAMIPLHRPGRRIEWRLGPSRVLLVGDAASHVKVTTVGGLVSGIWGAEAATKALLAGTSYRGELRSLHRELYLHDLIRWGMDRFTDGRYDALVRVMTPALVRLLGRRNRDSMAGAMHRLFLAQPGLTRIALGALLAPYSGDAPRGSRPLLGAPQSQGMGSGD